MSKLLAVISALLVIGGAYSFYIAVSKNIPNHPLFWQQLSQQAAAELRTLPETPLLNRPEVLQNIVKKLEISLAENPHQPYAWVNLSDAERAIGKATPARQITLWRNSLKSGFFEEALLHGRTRVGLMYFDYLEEADKQALQQQLQLAWQYQWYITSLTLHQYGHKELLLTVLNASDKKKLTTTLQKLDKKQVNEP